MDPKSTYDINIDPVVGKYNILNKLNTGMEVLQFVLAGVDEVLHYIMAMKIRDAILDTIYIELQPIHTFFQDNLCYNALVVNEQEPISSVLRAEKFLQGSQEDKG